MQQIKFSNATNFILIQRQNSSSFTAKTYEAFNFSRSEWKEKIPRNYNNLACFLLGTKCSKQSNT
jgi:hypothetical protein